MRERIMHMRTNITLILICIAYLVSSCSYGQSTNLCTILKVPNKYADVGVTVDGIVFWGVDNLNISSDKCPGESIKLVIDDAVFNNEDIQNFYDILSKSNHVGTATVEGKFAVSKIQYPHYIIHVEHIRNVQPIE